MKSNELSINPSVNYSELTQIRVSLQAPGHSMRSLSIIQAITPLVCKGRQRGLTVTVHTRNTTERQPSWLCHFKGDLDTFLTLNVHSVNKCLMSVFMIPVLTEFIF